MLRQLFLISLLFALAAGSVGCGLKNRVPRYRFNADGEVVPFKRYALHQSLDYWYRWQRPAYFDVSEPLTKNLSPTQRDVLARHGQPDYIRLNFEAETHELVDEWVFWDQQVIVQFVQRELVYEGPVTEMDTIRVVYGYPDKAYAQQLETGPRRELWDYLGLYDRYGMVFTFSDEKLVSQHQY